MATAVPNPTTARTRRIPWPTVVTALSILVQIAGMGALLYLQILSQEQVNFARLTVEAIIEALLGLALFGLATLAIIISGVLAMFSTLRRWRHAWSNAMFVQMLILVTGLVLYTRERPWYTYPVMLAGVLVVTYLMLPGVQAAFLPPPEAAHD